MPFIEWKEDYNVWEDRVDQQHRSLVDIINKLHDAMRQGKAQQELGNILQELIDYTVHHFTYEEKIMIACNDIDYLHHRKAHDDLVKEVKKFQEDFKNKKAMLSVQIFDFLKRWLIDHILTIDKKMHSRIIESRLHHQN